MIHIYLKLYSQYVLIVGHNRIYLKERRRKKLNHIDDNINAFLSYLKQYPFITLRE